jgi:hypothetical protein
VSSNRRWLPNELGVVTRDSEFANHSNLNGASEHLIASGANTVKYEHVRFLTCLAFDQLPLGERFTFPFAGRPPAGGPFSRGF